MENGKVNCIAWQDKKLVHFVDTISNPLDSTQVTRKNKDGSQILVTCQHAVKMYNSSMGVVDVADSKPKVYSCSRKSNKWWHRLYYFILDVSIINAHIIQSKTPNQPIMTQKMFRLELARELLCSHKSRKHRKRGRHFSTDPSPSMQLNASNYPDQLSKPLQCRYCSLAKKTAMNFFLLQRLQQH